MFSLGLIINDNNYSNTWGMNLLSTSPNISWTVRFSIFVGRNGHYSQLWVSTRYISLLFLLVALKIIFNWWIILPGIGHWVDIGPSGTLCYHWLTWMIKCQLINLQRQSIIGSYLLKNSWNLNSKLRVLAFLAKKINAFINNTGSVEWSFCPLKLCSFIVFLDWNARWFIQ